MTPTEKKRKRFAENYCGKCAGNARQSAIEAGYSKSYAYTKADKLLKNKQVQGFIEQINAKGINKKSVKKSVSDVKKIASIQEIQAFWTDVMNDENEDMKHRIRTSELLAKTKGAFNSEW